MKKLLSVLFLSFCASLFAQEGETQKNPSVELPSFVITGKDVISLPKAKKMQSGFISTVSEEYFKPAFTPDDFEITSIPEPGKREFNSLDSVSFINGSVTGALGINYRPYAQADFAQQFEDGSFNIEGLAFNKRAYVENSDRYLFSGGAGFTFYIRDKSPFLSNSKINASGNYSVDGYKLYATSNPSANRKLESGKFDFVFNNPSSNSLAYDFDLFNTISKIQSEHYTENVTGLKAYAQIPISNFNLNGKAILLNQRLSNGIFANKNYRLFDIKPYAGLALSKIVKVQAGFDFFNSDSVTEGYLYGAIEIPLSIGFSIYGEFSPQSSLMSFYDISKENRFFNVQSVQNIIVKKKNFMTVNFKYEYEKYYEINGGFEYFSSDKYPWLGDVKDTGLYNVNYSSVKSGALFVNFLFHKGPYGYFYGDVRFNKVNTDDNKQLPFVPEFTTNLNYGYDLGNGMAMECKLKYRNMTYTDILNKDKLGQYIDFSIKGIYNYSPVFSFFGEINNLLNNKNYFLKGYQEDTFNLNFGINYKL